MQFHCWAEGWLPALKGKAQDIWFSFTLSIICPNNRDTCMEQTLAVTLRY